MLNNYTQQYKVIKIISKNSILINFGIQQGAKIGKKIRVVTLGDEIIFDNENFGTYDYIKEELEIVKVFEYFSECKKFILKPSEFTRDLSSMTNTIASILGKTKANVSLNVNDKQIEPLNLQFEEDSTINLGDTVKVISIDK